MNNHIFEELKKKIEIQDFIGAEKICLQLFEKQPNSLHAIKNLGLVLMLQEKAYEAIEIYEKAYLINNQDFDVNMNLAYLFKNIEEFEKSLAFIDLAEKINPQSALPFKTQSEIFLKLRKFDLAKEAAEKALTNLNNGQYTDEFKNEINYRYLEILSTEKHSLLFKEKINVLANGPSNPDILLYQAKSSKETITDSQVKSAESKIAELQNKNDIQNIKLISGYYFALATYYLNLGNVKKSEDYFIQGNEKNHLLCKYRPLDTQKYIKKIIRDYQELPQIDIEENYGEDLVFIVGMPRSGTTLVESIVANSDDVFAGGELASFKNLVQIEITKKYKNNPGRFREAINNYKQKMNFLKGSKKYLIDKLPFNAFLMGFIYKFLPSAKILLVDRDPWDIAISIYQQFYFKKHFYSTKFFNIAMQIANYYYIRDYWLSENNGNILKIQYEDLVLDPSTYAQTIYKHIGIQHDYDPELRKKFYSNTASYGQVKEEVHTKSLKKQFLETIKSNSIQTLKSRKNIGNLLKKNDFIVAILQHILNFFNILTKIVAKRANMTILGTSLFK